MLNDPLIVEAVDYLTNEQNTELNQRILRRMPFGELVHFNAFEKGVYPQELLDQAVEAHSPILWSIKEMSENESLDAIIDETEAKMIEAAKTTGTQTHILKRGIKSTL